jgi:hypothetical protein
MRVMHRRISSAIEVLLVSTSLSAAALGAGFAVEDRGRSDEAAARDHTPMAPPALSPTSAPIVMPAVGTTRTDEFTGAEPDPETFDQRSLDIWWQRYQNAGREAE